MRKKLYLFLFIFILGFFIAVIPSSVKAFDDLDFTFERDILFDTSSPSIIYQNLRTRETYTETYEATFSFTEDVVGSEPAGFSITITGTGSAIVHDNLLGHDKVLELNDTDALDNVNVLNIWSPRSSGSIEYWMLNTDATDSLEALFSLVGTLMFGLKIDADKFQYFDGGWNDIGLSAVDNRWYRICINYECTAGGFKDLAQYDYNVIINGQEFGDFDFASNQANVDRILFRTLGPPTNKGYFDAYGRSFDIGYDEGDNLIPTKIIHSSEGMETDKYEFAFETQDNMAEIGQHSFGLWIFSETGSGLSQITADNETDRKVSLNTGADEGSSRIRRTNLGRTAELIDVNIGFEMTTGNDASFNIHLDSSDTTQMVVLSFQVDTGLLKYQLTGGGFVELRDDIALSVEYDANIFLSYSADTVRLELFGNSVFLDSYEFPMKVAGKTGLHEIELISGTSDGDVFSNTNIDYVGLYINGDSWSGEPGLMQILVNETWNMEHQYLYSFIQTGNIHQGVVNGTYDAREESGARSLFVEIIGDSFPERSGVEEVFNVFDSSDVNITEANLVLTCSGDNISVSAIAIEGTKLTEGINEYFLEYTAASVNISESFFFVNDNNELRFILNSDEDGVLEFIQAEFNINNRSSDDTVISYTSQIVSGNGFGFFRIKYNDTSQVIQMENIIRTRRIVLNRAETIDSFIVLVSDNDRDDVVGDTTGLVKGISLLDVENAFSTIITLNLIDMLIPLLIILIPTFLIGSFGKKFIIPTFLMISIVLTISSIIPIWLFFVIGISFSTFIFIKRTEEF